MPPTSRTYSQPPPAHSDPQEPTSPASPPLSGTANEFHPLVSSSLNRSPGTPTSIASSSSRPQVLFRQSAPQQQQHSYSGAGGDADSTSSESIGTSSQHHKRMSSTFEDLTPETQGLSQGMRAGHNYSRYSAIPSRNSFGALTSSMDESDSPYASTTGGVTPNILTYNQNRASFYDTPAGQRASIGSIGALPFVQGDMVKAAQTDALLWDEKNLEDDDHLHNPDPGEFQRAGTVLKTGRSATDHFNWKSIRGISNVIGIIVVLGGLIGLFALWPIITNVEKSTKSKAMYGWNIGGTNSSGQVPEIDNFPSLIDSHTPDDAKTFTNSRGDEYKLVFSDEFNEDGRSFYPGDDPYWEAVDLNYWATHNYEWCHPDALTTKDGKLEITMTEQPIHDLSFRSGFLQSWNKFCFSKEAYVEVSLSLPGDPDTIGFWPGVWSMGNLGRAGYGATNDGTWPYSYDSCDAGTLPNQTYAGGNGPDAALHSGSSDYGGELSWLPGQRLSACTCSGDDHPGPKTSVGRSAPEIDILEAQVDYHGYGTASQSVQIAPFDPEYLWHNVTGEGYDIHIDNCTLNDWKGSINQESASGVSVIGTEPYGGDVYTTYGYEYKGDRDDGYITWYLHDKPSWTLYSAGFAPNDETDVGQRLISEEPMYLMLNLFISSKFQGNPDFGNLQFPATMYIDYVRVYQPKNDVNIGCDPKDHPTADYIQDHLNAYMNPNFTTWEEAGYEWPRNSMAEGGCNTDRAGP